MKASEPYTLTGRQAADLFTQAAFLRSHNNGQRMKEMLIFVRDMLKPTHGGAFVLDPNRDCHPRVPGMTFAMSEWLGDFEDTLDKHIALIRVAS